MSGWLVALIVLAVVFAGVGMQLLSVQMQRFPTDIRRPGPLIEVRRSKPPTVHTAELRRLVTVMSYALIGDASASSELQKVFDDLDAPTSPLIESTSSRREQRRRSEHLDRALRDLERRWGVEIDDA